MLLENGHPTLLELVYLQKPMIYFHHFFDFYFQLMLVPLFCHLKYEREEIQYLERFSPPQIPSLDYQYYV